MGNKDNGGVPGNLRGKTDVEVFVTEIEVGKVFITVSYRYEPYYVNGDPDNVKEFVVPTRVCVSKDGSMVDITDLLDGGLDEAVYEAIDKKTKGDYGV